MSGFRLWIWLFVFSGLIAVGPVLEARAQTPAVITWDTKFFNPKPDADDVVLPMPCGGGMAFRPVAVAVENVLDDVRLRVGGTEDSVAHFEGLRAVHLNGSFSDPENPSRRLYYIAKYELTDQQVAALQGNCQKPTIKGRLPAVGLNWIEAVTLADGYSQWLLQNAGPALPTEDGTAAFVRLPTEAEWEYAARGGLKVSTTEFQEKTFPAPSGLGGHAWFAGTRSSRGKLRPTGLKKPNPLGLHDVLGNADEIVLDAFRLNRLSRLHGLAGGFTVKGGNYLTPEEQLRSAYRQEVSHYTEKGPRKSRTVGARFALSVPVLTSTERLLDIRERWQSLARSSEEGARKDVREDPLEEIEAIAATVTDPGLKSRIEGFRLVLKANIASRDRQRDLAVRSFLRQGGLTAQKLEGDVRIVARTLTSIPILEKAGAPENTIKRAKDSLQAREEAFEGNLNVYSDLVIFVGDTFSPAILERQIKVLEAEFTEKGLTAQTDSVGLFMEHVFSYQENGSVDQDDLKESFHP